MNDDKPVDISNQQPVQPEKHYPHKPPYADELADKLSDELTVSELLKTMGWTAVGTALLVGIHHRYRHAQNPNARLQDYPRSFYQQFKRIQWASEQAVSTWQHAYQQYDEYDKTDGLVQPTYTNSDHAQAKQQPPQPHNDINNSNKKVTSPNSPTAWVSGVAALSEGGYGVVGIDGHRQIIWQTPMPERVHDIVVQPDKLSYQDVVVMGRRPSEWFWVLDTSTGQQKYRIKSNEQRHFYGHACFSHDGTRLYVTENDTETLQGKIGVYDALQGYNKIAEFDTHGIGPHELVMHPNPNTDMLIIANGGIKTEKASREELNLDTMRPSLVYLNRHDGSLLQQVTPEHNQMSVRHLAVHDDGTVMIGIQFQGQKHLNIPLVLTHQFGEESFTALKMADGQWYCFHQYIASVAVDSKNHLLCATSPIGGCAVVFDLKTRTQITSITLPDCAGTAILPKKANLAGFIVSDGQGMLTTLHAKPLSDNPMIQSQLPVTSKTWQIIDEQTYHKMSFDNHLQAV